MKTKFPFMFSKEQRKGILFLVFLIVIFQCIYFFVDFSSQETRVNQSELTKINATIDSLKLVKIETIKPKIYPFNPNYITDYKGTVLGMTNLEIDRLFAFRKQNKWINTIKQFQDVTKVSDSLLKVIGPYFKFPNWVKKLVSKQKSYDVNYNTSKIFREKHDLNKASAEELQKINGIGKVLSSRIIKYRNKYIGGFIADIQLQDVYGLTPEVIERLTEGFTVKTPRQIQKININKATIEELVSVQHIDYDIAHDIVEQRILREGYKSLDELLKVKSFPENKIDIIKLSLSLD